MEPYVSIWTKIIELSKTSGVVPGVVSIVVGVCAVIKLYLKRRCGLKFTHLVSKDASIQEASYSSTGEIHIKRGEVKNIS